MTAYSFSFVWKGRRHYFIPNRVFWVLLLTVFGALTGWVVGLGAEYYALSQHFNTISAPEAEPVLYEIMQVAGSEGHKAPSKAVEMGFSFFAGLSSLLNIIIRKLISWSLKLNNVVLLAGSKIEALQVSPIEMKLGKRAMHFQPSRHFWKFLGGGFVILVGVIAYLTYSRSRMEEKISLLQLKSAGIDQIDVEGGYKDDIMGYLIDYFNEYEANRKSLQQNFREKFLMQKHLLTSQYLIREKVSRVDQLPNEALIEMNEKLSNFFKDLVLDKIDIEPHVYEFFTDESDLKKIETALMEQAKYHVPASITLAQAALETAYGRRVMHNNYFGIKDKDNSPRGYMTTTEYYTAKEVSLNKSKIISKKKVNKGGKELYKCLVKDSFMRYNTAWASFRAHSLFLAGNSRYHPLFTGGKNYEAWAEKIGSTKYGGVGYATSPIYGELLKKIIRRYGLDVLDY